MAVKQVIRRLLFGNTPGDKLDDTPIELPAGHFQRKSVAQEIQEQIAIQIALKQSAAGEGELQTIAEIEAELEALDSDEEPNPYPEYQYIEMVDDGIDAVVEDLQTPEPVSAPVQDQGVKEET